MVGVGWLLTHPLKSTMRGENDVNRWFADQRTPVRRMGVSCHVEHGVFVLSLWQADVCTGTFRLSMADAPALVAKLLEGLNDPDAGPDLKLVQ